MKTRTLTHDRLYRLLRTLDGAVLNGDADRDESEDGVEYFNSDHWDARHEITADGRTLAIAHNFGQDNERITTYACTF